MEEEEAVFEFETVLGEGSFGTVYLIRDKEDRQYAVKRINFQGQESERTQALREAELLSKVRHEHILNYIESFEDDECLYIVTEYCDGGDLEVYLQSSNRKSLPEVLICHWIYQIASGLQHLHDQKILHRDLKTKNIFMMCDLSLKLGDLGIAKLLELNQSKAESFVGTPAYMSPELFKTVPYNHKSDIWSFGCCCYEMVALKKAFRYDSWPALSQMVCSGKRPPFPPNYSDSLKCIVYSMLVQEPDCRPSATHIVSNVYIRKRLAEPIDKSNSQDRHNKNQQSKGKERESKTQSAKERREKAEKKYQTMSHAWLTIKHEISTYRLENQRKSVKRTMEQMKKLKLRSVKQENDDTDMCTYRNHSDTADYNGDNTDDESTLIIDFVQISNSREDRIGDTESQTSYLEDDVFEVKKHEERSTVYQDQAGELIMREQLPPYQYNRAPFLVRRQESDPILRDSSSNNKGTQKTKKKRIFGKFEEAIIEDMESELVVPNTSNSQRLTTVEH